MYVIGHQLLMSAVGSHVMMKYRVAAVQDESDWQKFPQVSFFFLMEEHQVRLKESLSDD